MSGEQLEEGLDLSCSELRRVYHDYQAALRVLRYLAEKSLDPRDGDWAEKNHGLQKHLKGLDDFQSKVIRPLLKVRLKSH